MFSLKQGSELVKHARKSIESVFEGKPIKELKGFNKKHGVFVTILNFPHHELRGCIGFPYPVMPLCKAIEEAAKSAAFSDTRFLPLQKKELNNVIIEISVLSVPQEIKCKKEDLCKSIKIGKDGLIVSCQGYSGLLLPQVAPEWHWNSKEFLEQTCIKAGLLAETWKNPKCKIYKFQAQIFAEEQPKGNVVEKIEKS
jgi:hypothetical protein